MSGHDEGSVSASVPMTFREHVTPEEVNLDENRSKG